MKESMYTTLILLHTVCSWYLGQLQALDREC